MCLFSSSISVFAQKKLEINDFIIEDQKVINESAFEFSKTDTFSYDLKIVYSGNDRPKFYYTKLITPVCESGHCYLVSIKIFWDLVGTYLHFEMPADRVLTKMDHEHFTTADYGKLQRILSDAQWPLAQYELNQLIIDSTKTLIDSEIDAYSGATAPFVREKDNIPGALYTIYSLWEFAHDEPIIQKLRNYTDGVIEKGVLDLKDFLSSERKSYWKWAVEKLEKVKIDQNIYPLLWNIIDKADQYLSFEILNLIEADSIQVQTQLWELFQKVSIYKKRDIIQTLEIQKVNDQILIDMLKYLSHTDDPMERLILKKLINKNHPLSEDVLSAVSEYGVEGI